MPKSVEQVRQQIEKLKKQERALLQKEIPGVLKRIKAAVAYYGLTPEQIFGDDEHAGGSAETTGAKRRGARSSALGLRHKPAGTAQSRAARGGKAPSPAKGTKVPPKYKDDAGNTWSGRGNQPRWLRAAIESGKNLEDFVIA